MGNDCSSIASALPQNCQTLSAEGMSNSNNREVVVGEGGETTVGMFSAELPRDKHRTAPLQTQHMSQILLPFRIVSSRSKASRPLLVWPDRCHCSSHFAGDTQPTQIVTHFTFKCVSPSTNQHLCTILCIPNYILFTTPTFRCLQKPPPGSSV
jgi:hypothetical protein